ncbi:hypothetical protein Tco_0324804 [Tanacetum coccineum]
MTMVASVDEDGSGGGVVAVVAVREVMVDWVATGGCGGVVVRLWWSQRGVEVDGGDDVGCSVVMEVMMVWWVSAAGWPESGWRRPKMMGGEEMYVCARVMIK